MGCAVGALLGLPELRLPKAYLALLTLSAAVAFPIVLRQLDGPLPVTLDGRICPACLDGDAPNDEHIWEFWIVLAWVVVAFWLLRRLLAGPIGRAFIASRDDPTAAAAFGVSVYRLRLAGVSLSGGLAGLAGGLLLVPVNFNDQTQYAEVLSIKVVRTCGRFREHSYRRQSAHHDRASSCRAGALAGLVRRSARLGDPRRLDRLAEIRGIPVRGAAAGCCLRPQPPGTSSPVLRRVTARRPLGRDLCRCRRAKVTFGVRNEPYRTSGRLLHGDRPRRRYGRNCAVACSAGNLHDAGRGLRASSGNRPRRCSRAGIATADYER